MESEITAQLAQVAQEQTVGTFRKDGENDETDSIKSTGSTRSSDLQVKVRSSLDVENPEELDEKNEEEETPKKSSRKSGNIKNKQSRPANARMGWKPNPRHENMVLRLAKRHASGGYCKRHLSRRPFQKNAIKLPDLSAGRKAFDRTSYQHSCPVTVYKNRMERVGY